MGKAVAVGRRRSAGPGGVLRVHRLISSSGRALRTSCCGAGAGAGLEERWPGIWRRHATGMNA
jgi:hypothetical protein